MGLNSKTPEDTADELLIMFKYRLERKSTIRWDYILKNIACFMRKQDKKQEWYNVLNSNIVDNMLQEMKELYNKNKNELSEEIQQLLDNWFSKHSNTFSRWKSASECTFKQDIPQYLMKMITRPQRYNSNYNNLRY